MPSIRYSEVRKGMVIVEEGQLYYCVDRKLKTVQRFMDLLKS